MAKKGPLCCGWSGGWVAVKGGGREAEKEGGRQANDMHRTAEEVREIAGVLVEQF